MFRNIMLLAAALLSLSACEGDHEVVETDWTTLETVELQKQYNKYMNGDWEYAYRDSVHHIELRYSFSTRDSTVTGYYSEAIHMASTHGNEAEWQLLWQGEFKAKWALLHSVELLHDYIYMENMEYKNVLGVLQGYDIMAGRVLFYGASKHTLSVTTPITFRKIDMHHPSSSAQ